MRTSIKAVLLAFLFCCANARGQALLTFAGGNGVPLSVTLTQSVVYAVTAASENVTGFNCDAVGDFFQNSGHPVTGNMTFSINSGPPQEINFIGSGFSGGDITSDDFQLLGFVFEVNIGDVVTLNAGTVTTFEDITAAPPSSGAFNTFIATNDTHVSISSPGVAVPEPGSLAFGLIGGVALLCIWHKRSRRGFV